MKEGISLTTLFKALVLFTILFAAFLSLAIIYNKAYKLKNEVLTIIEKYEGITSTSLGIINNYLYLNGYSAMGSCEVGEYGSTDLTNTNLELVNSSNKRYYYCLSQKCTTGRCVVENNNKIYFKFKIFFGFNLPYFEDLLTFNVSGEKKIRFFDLDQRL